MIQDQDIFQSSPILKRKLIPLSQNEFNNEKSLEISKKQVEVVATFRVEKPILFVEASEISVNPQKNDSDQAKSKF